MIHDKRRFGVVLAALAVAFAPHLGHVPVLVSLFVCLAWGYALGMQFLGWPVPSRWLRIALTLVCLGVVLAAFGRSFGRDAGVALLSLMLGLKAVESKSSRDLLALLFLAYFVVVTGVLYSQTLVMSGYMIFSVLVVTAALVHLYSAEDRVGPDLLRAVLLFVQALPLALVLFVFFPRLQGALWGVQDARDDAVSGFSQTLEPGAVSELSLSRDVAFRVDFSGPVPERGSLYWRGLVLDSFDGIRWFRDLPFELAATGDEPAAGGIAYDLTLEPHGQEWIFVLDLPVKVPKGTALREDRTMVSLRAVRTRARYALVSFPGLDSGPQPGTWATALPEEGNPQARDLARQWREQGLPARAMVQAVLDLFRTGGFSYSLRPGSLDGDIIDQFLFASRRGYCEHYASALAFLLRSAGVPARIVVGYQGGEINPVGGYLIVRQSEAHAWTEVWLDGRWTRIDPTSVVAPLRLAAGAEPFASRETGAVLPEGVRYFRQVGRVFGLGWDAANNAWNQWVLGFGHERQRGLWERLGFDPATRAGAGRLALVLLTGIGAVLSAVVFLALRTRQQDRDPVADLYARFCRKLARAGLPRGPAEGPLDHASRVEMSRPDLGTVVREIAWAYVAVRYRGQDKDMTEFKRLIGDFMGRRL
jgi:transglutaminase-like putative cysteine protease